MRAFALDIAREIFTHKLLMVRALVVGLAAAIITGQWLVLPLMGVLLPEGLTNADGSFSWYRFLTIWAPVHGTHGALVGWIIARSHRNCRTAALVVFVAVGLPAVIPNLVRLAGQQSPRFLPVLAQTFWPVACLVVSGLLLVGPHPHLRGFVVER